jgi:hypothetical protein
LETEEECLLEETKDPEIEDCFTEAAIWALVTPPAREAPWKTWEISWLFLVFGAAAADWRL